ncbi:MAG: holin [Clostridia bacterium]
MKEFLKDMAERAIKTGAQVAIATIGTASILGEINWLTIGSTVAVATIVSLLTSIASYNVGDTGTASIINNS